ncbi:unnamed protein product [Rotaria magnacalcarata]|uniref:Uncharacterized protein n=1 Tax=Rotaria magnacalcarata TaxID=392030 RepID=A0A815R8V1_9BILA|nr:unnamed protein product [Rotaria magnacalcarata]CAF1680201.1 unnamed protein product [Rotaria magnacalcarata]CAF2074086.1 unnamed protein product [Rotaria magnacalcarata]CAF3833704.1 unnamed protein product [Rotaria magnacalcarata]CAF3838041.1 unnamed protein product [Rotaria magnacalcarata]
MSTTATVIVYDQNGYHAAAARDPTTEIVSSSENLIESLNNKEYECLSVGICSRNKSRIIDNILGLSKVTSIWLCEYPEHGGPEEDPLHHPKVKEIFFNSGENDLHNLEFEGHMYNSEYCQRKECRVQEDFENAALIRINEEWLENIPKSYQPEESHKASSAEEVQTSTETQN